MRNQVHLLGEATLQLYPADATGVLVVGDPIWVGACAERLRLSQAFDEMDRTPTGDAHRRVRMIPGRHQIGMDRLWVLRNADLTDYTPNPHGAHVLVVTWENDKGWHRRTYTDVQVGETVLESQGVMEFNANQAFTAGGFLAASGFGAYSPAAVASNTEHGVFFSLLSGVKENAHALGHYAWPVIKQLMSAKAIGLASQTETTVLTLEVGGVLTAHTLTLPIGSEGAEVSNEIVFSGVTVPASTGVRWKVTNAPAAEADQAELVAVVMRVQ